MKAKRATSDHRWLAGLLLTLSIAFIGGCAGICNIEQASAETGRPLSIPTDNNTTPIDVSTLATQTFQKTEQFRINQIVRTSNRNEYERFKNQLIDFETAASSSDSAGMAGDTVRDDGNSIPGNVTVPRPVVWTLV